MELLSLKIFFVMLLVMVLCEEEVDGWFRRRRRRRWVPPPPQDCTVSDWSAWSACSQLCHIGTRRRTRTVTTVAMWGGSCPYQLTETEACGSINGGCEQICHNGQCSCQAGYVASGNNCNDLNECSSTPCSHTCINTIGSFYCECPMGFFLTGDSLTCEKYDCGSPVPLFSACPLNSYSNHNSSVCTEVTVTCPSGTMYDEQCFLNCPANYSLSKITDQPDTQFGQNYSAVDFVSVLSTILCQKAQASQTVNVWDVPDAELNQYFCRRSNDPPMKLKLNGSSLREHSTIGTVIGTLSSEDAQPGQTFIYTVQVPASLLIAQEDKLINAWDNPRLNGNITLDNKMLSVTIRSTDDGVPPMWLERTFSITIVDVNDPPEQIQLSNSIINENATVGTVIGELTAIDGDDPLYTIPHSNFRWELVENDEGRFAINNEKITVALPLIGEAQKLHKIAIRCSDYGDPVQNKTEHFIITVVNINDAPSSLRFLGTNVHETANVGTIVGQLVVTEKDGDDLSFSIHQSDTDTLAKFKIESSGCQGPGHEYECKVNVTVKSSLDFESKAWYTLNVLVNDSNTRAFKQFKIEVVDDNEAPTAIRLTGSHSVLENAVAGSVVGQFMVSDPDNANFPSHQTHRCEFDVSKPSDEHYFVITTGLVLKVKGAQQINYEEIKNLTFTVTCTDSGHPPLSISRDFFILVQDVNESPVNLTLSATAVDENSALGTVVGVLSSDDLDGPSNNYHTYSIVAPVSIPFIIGGGDHEKRLLVNGLLDHEANPTLVVVIRATDKGGLFTQKTFKITVDDVNDPPTNITLPMPYFKENSAEQVLISPIILVDQDSDLPSCTLLDSAGGRVKVVGANLVVGPTMTDYESLPSPQQISITLNCSDGNGMFIWKTFTITVKDVNEQPSAVLLNAVSISENEADTVVGQLTVLDPDAGQQHLCTVHNQVVDTVLRTERLVPSHFFAVDTSLNLKTLNGLNFEAQHSINVVINCSDVVAEGSLSKSQLFTIIVKDVNEIPSGLCNAPIIMGTLASNGAIIANFNGRDPDNENTFNRDLDNTTVVVKNKQRLLYSLSPAQHNPWPFRIMGNNLYKSGDISQAGNMTINVKVEDDGVIVASFSSRGYKYMISTPLSAIFTCTIIVSEHQQSHGIRLGSSSVSVTAENGSVVSTFSTDSPNPEETFTYELVEEAERPFIISGNKLIVVRKEGLDFQFSRSDDFVISVTVISRGSFGSLFTESFYITVVDDRPNSVDICLNSNTVYKNQPEDSLVGQVIIDDSSSPLLTCSKQHCCPLNGRQFDYECNINNPEDNESLIQIQNNVTAIFRLDKQFRLLTKVRVNSSIIANTNGSLAIQISCLDILHPLHFFGQPLSVYFAECDSSGICPDISNCPVCQNGGSCQDALDGYSCQCIMGYTGRHCETDINDCQGVECLNGGSCQDGIASFACLCADGFSGQRCERMQSLCANCTTDTLCVMFIRASIRCLEKQYHIPVLVNESEISQTSIFELEKEIGATLDANVPDHNTVSTRKKRALSSFFYVEVLRTAKISPSETLIILTALDARNDFFPLLASQVCAMLSSTPFKCVENCDMLKVFGLPCGQAEKIFVGPSQEKPEGLGAGEVTGIAVVVVLVLIALLLGAIFYYRRKYKRERQEQREVSYRADTEDIDFNNELYLDVNNVVTSASPNRFWTEKLRKQSDSLLQRNLDPTSVVKRNDVKVSENPIYSSADNRKAKSVNLSKEDDIVASKERNKEENPYLEPKDCAFGGAMNPCYARSSSSGVSLGVKGAELQGNEVVEAEQELDAHMKGASAVVCASSVPRPKKLKRQWNTGKENRELELQSLKMGEVPPSFENPFYNGRGGGGDSTRDTRAPDNGLYSTIPDVQPRLPPIPARRINEASSESLGIREQNDHYESLNFGNFNA